MSNVVNFTRSPLAPFLGTWMRDPLSVSRNKIVKRLVGADDLKKLWACHSMNDRAEFLAMDSALEEKYRNVAGIAESQIGSQIEITLQSILWKGSDGSTRAPADWVFQITRAAAESRKVIVHSINLRPEKRGKPVAFVLRMNKQWLLMSEQYSGAQAGIFPRSPVFRYYRQS